MCVCVCIQKSIVLIQGVLEEVELPCSSRSHDPAISSILLIVVYLIVRSGSFILVMH